MQMGEQERLMGQSGQGELGYIPNFAQMYFNAKAQAQQSQARQAELDDHTQSNAVDNAYASNDPTAIAKVNSMYPAKVKQYKDQQEGLQDKKQAAQLELHNMKMTAFSNQLRMAPDYDSYTKQHDSFAKFTDDGSVPDPGKGNYSEWRNQVLGGIAKQKVQHDGLLGYFEASQDPSASPEERAAALDQYRLGTQKLKDEHNLITSKINGTQKTPKAESSPNQNDLNSSQAIIAGSSLLSSLGADVPEDKKAGTPYQIGQQGVARNWLAQNTEDLLHQDPKMTRGDATLASQQEAELRVVTDDKGNKTFDTQAQVVRANGKLWRMVGQDPTNGYKLQDKHGKQIWYKPKKNKGT
jgi:hypothetical protein